MPFPPNLGITSALIIDSRSPILLPDFPSLLVPQLHRANMNAYSRIGKSRSTKSKSLDYADLSFLHSTPMVQGSNVNFVATLQSHQDNALRSPIPEHRIGDGVVREALGIIRDRNNPVASSHSNNKVNYHQYLPQQSVVKKKRINRRSASLFEGYNPIHQQFESITEDVDQQEVKPYVKKKGRFFKACKRLFGL